MKSVDPGIKENSSCFSFMPSNKTKKLFFYLTWCGHYYCTTNYYLKRNYYSPLLLIFICEGALDIKYKGASFIANKNDIVLLDCSNPHYYRALDGLEFLYIHFDGSNAHELCHYIIEKNGPLIQSEKNLLISKHLFSMVTFFEKNNFESDFETSAKIYQILLLLDSIDKVEDSPDHPIDLTLHYIHDHIGKNISLSELAKIANLSPYYYSHLFKQKTRFAPIEYVINSRINKAKNLLITTRLSIEEIAFNVGYSSSGSFINVFTQKIGTSPKKYRKSHETL